jgi:RNA polymerase sigma-70 factor (ECF subfamily)
VSGSSDKRDGPAGVELIGWLLDRHAAALELYAGQLCDCPEDVVQEALIQLVGQATTPADVVAWLYRVVRNKALNASRAAKRRRRREADAAEQRVACLHGSELIDAEAVAAALATLSGEQREVLVAHVWGELPFEQIGQMMDTSASTAHRQYQAALSRLRERLGVSCPQKRKTTD